MKPADDRAEVRKRSLTISGHRTSISLEDAFWDGLQAIADRNTCSLASLVADVDRGRGAANLSSAVRVFVLNSLKADAGQAGSPATEAKTRTGRHSALR